jgi:predicted aldo/keto reductase-like oxidoreductase
MCYPPFDKLGYEVSALGFGCMRLPTTPEGAIGEAEATPMLASACIQCRECDPKCPQSIPISEWMPIIHAVLGEGKAYTPRDCPRP